MSQALYELHNDPFIWPPWRLEDSGESAEEILLPWHAGRRRNARQKVCSMC